MEDHDTLMQSRQNLAIFATSYLTSSRMDKVLDRMNVRDESGQHVVVMVPSEEPAVVAVHRFEAMRTPRFAALTFYNGRPRLLGVVADFDQSQSEAVEEVAGGMTFRDLVDQIRHNEALTVKATGEEFRDEIMSITSQPVPTSTPALAELMPS